jgi:hypothetical protein
MPGLRSKSSHLSRRAPLRRSFSLRIAEEHKGGRASGESCGRPRDLNSRAAYAVGDDVGRLGNDEFADAGDAARRAEFGVLRKQVLEAVEDVQRDALCGGRIMFGNVRAQGEKVVNGFRRPDERHTRLGAGRSLRVSQEPTQSLTRACEMPLPRSSEERAFCMPATCHSLVSRWATIASTARNERERPVLLASFSRRCLVERPTRTENVVVVIRANLRMPSAPQCKPRSTSD